jgi:hypothetical protein
MKPILKKGKCSVCQKVSLIYKKRCYSCYIETSEEIFKRGNVEAEEMLTLSQRADEDAKDSAQKLREEMVVANRALFGTDYVPKN